MAKQIINIGSAANDGTGDPLRSAFDKINDNFNELYLELGGDSVSNISLSGNTIGTDDTNGNLTLDPNGTGSVIIATGTNLQLADHTDNGIIKFDASGNLAVSGIIDDGTTITHGDFKLNTSTMAITSPTDNAGSFVVGKSYAITFAGNTDFTTVGSTDSNVGTIFTATGLGTGTGTATRQQDITLTPTNGEVIVE